MSGKRQRIDPNRPREMQCPLCNSAWTSRDHNRGGRNVVRCPDCMAAPCAVDGCDKPKRPEHGPYCYMHAGRRYRKGIVGGAEPLKTVRNNRNAAGYVYRTIDGRSVLEHRLVMEQILGRPLWPDENVHHVNGVRDDNRPENLELWSTSQPCGQRIPDKVAHALEILARYAPELLDRSAVA